MMTSEEATAANQELHSRLTLVEGTVNGPTASGASGVVVRRMTLAEQLVNTTGATSVCTSATALVASSGRQRSTDTTIAWSSRSGYHAESP